MSKRKKKNLTKNKTFIVEDLEDSDYLKMLLFQRYLLPQSEEPQNRKLHSNLIILSQSYLRETELKTDILKQLKGYEEEWKRCEISNFITAGKLSHLCMDQKPQITMIGAQGALDIAKEKKTSILKVI